MSCLSESLDFKYFYLVTIGLFSSLSVDDEPVCLSPVQVCAVKHDYLELRPIRPQLRRLHELLHESPYSGPETEAGQQAGQQAGGQQAEDQQACRVSTLDSQAGHIVRRYQGKTHYLCKMFWLCHWIFRGHRINCICYWVGQLPHPL